MISPSSTSATLPLDNLSEDGVVPEKRVASASDAQAITRSLVEANRERSRFNSKVKGMFQGNPPYDHQKLMAAGQGYRANVNFLEGKAARCAALVPYYDLFSGAKFYCQVRTNVGNDQEKQDWSDILTEEFDRLLRTYRAFDFNMQKMLADLVGYGSGFLMWYDKTDWHFTCAPRHKVYVPDGTDACTDNLDVVTFRERMQVHKLWGFIKNRKAAERIGWNVDATARAIGNAYPEIQGESSTQYNFEWLQQKMKDRDLVEGIRSATVPIAHVLVKEFSGKITHMMIFENMGHSKYEKSMADDFLYEKTGRFDNFRQFLAGFFLETLDGSWNGVNGIGHDIYSAMAIKDRLKCSVIDQVFLKCGVTLQAKTAAALQKTSLVQAGVFNIIPPDYDVQQATILGDSNSPVMLDRTLDNMLVANTGVYRQRVQKEDGNPITAEQARIDQTNSTVLSNSAVNRFYGDLDPFYAELYRRASSDGQHDSGGDGPAAAKEFQQRCQAKGVPAKAIRDVEYVRAYRNAGNGSGYMRQQNIQSTMPFYPMMPESGKQNFLSYALASIHGQSMVNLFNPVADRQKLPNDHEAMAALENSAMKQNAPVVWTPTQNNLIHATSHLQSGAQAAGSLQAGAKPEDVINYLEAVGGHTAIHLQELQKDPTQKPQVKALTDQFQQLAAIHDKLKKHVQDAQQQAQQKQQEQQQAAVQAAQIGAGTDPSTMIQAAKTAHAMKLHDEKTRQAMDQKDAKSKQDMALRDAKAANEIRIQNAKAHQQLKQS